MGLNWLVHTMFVNLFLNSSRCDLSNKDFQKTQAHEEHLTGHIEMAFPKIFPYPYHPNIGLFSMVNYGKRKQIYHTWTIP